MGSGLLSRPPRAAGNLVKAGEIGDPARPVTPRLRSIDSRINATSLTGLRGDTIGGSPLHEISYLPSTVVVRSAAIWNGRGCVTPTFTLVWQTGKQGGRQAEGPAPAYRIIPSDMRCGWAFGAVTCEQQGRGLLGLHRPEDYTTPISEV